MSNADTFLSSIRLISYFLDILITAARIELFRERGELTLPCDAAACFTKPQQGLTEVREYALDDAAKAAEVIAFLMGNKRIGV